MHFGSQNILWCSKPENMSCSFVQKKKGRWRLKDKMSFLVWGVLGKHPDPSSGGEEKRGKHWQMLAIDAQIPAERVIYICLLNTLLAEAFLGLQLQFPYRAKRKSWHEKAEFLELETLSVARLRIFRIWSGCRYHWAHCRCVMTGGQGLSPDKKPGIKRNINMHYRSFLRHQHLLLA